MSTTFSEGLDADHIARRGRLVTGRLDNSARPSSHTHLPPLPVLPDPSSTKAAGAPVPVSGASLRTRLRRLPPDTSVVESSRSIATGPAPRWRPSTVV